MLLKAVCAPMLHHSPNSLVDQSAPYLDQDSNRNKSLKMLFHSYGSQLALLVFLALFTVFLILLNTKAFLSSQDCLCEIPLPLKIIQIRPLMFVTKNSRYSLQRKIG